MNDAKVAGNRRRYCNSSYEILVNYKGLHYMPRLGK
jgi:hypothetical protein